MAIAPAELRVKELIRRLDEAVGLPTEREIGYAVKAILEDVINADHQFLPERYLRTQPNRYARHLLHLDPAGRYSVLVMVWDVGQGTPLHDHAGMWCVECVYKGRIQVTSYNVIGEPTDIPVKFEQESVIFAGIGEAGALIPPFEYHKIENPDDTPAVTIHVYGGEMTWCHAFVPIEGGYKREYRELRYTE
jgi:predicted metal-dependent enzyme (double-stranded beta helix superfamily)